MKPEDLIDAVRDRETFITFVRALADERERAHKFETEHARRYTADGAFAWMNGDIPSFLYAALRYFDDGPLQESVPNEPSWRMLAEILWCGKMIE